MLFVGVSVILGGNPDKHVGPPALSRTYRVIVDTRDMATCARLDNLEDPYRVFRRRTILNCTDICPKNLHPAYVIGQIGSMLVCRMELARMNAGTRRS